MRVLLSKLVYLNGRNVVKEKGARGYVTMLVCMELKGDLIEVRSIKFTANGRN